MKAKINRQKPYYAYITINRHWKKIIIAGVVTFAILFPIIKIKTKVYYEASGRIKIDPTNAAILQNSENSITGYYDKYVKTQAEKIKSTQIIRSAVEKIDGMVIKNVFHTDKKGMENIMYGIIEAEQESGTHLMTVTAKGKSAAGIADVVNAVMEAYIEKDMDEERKKDSVRIDYLQKQKENLENEITKKNVAIDLIVKNTGIGDFEASEAPYKAQTGNLESAYTTAYTDRIEKEKKYNEIKEKIKKIEKLSFEGAVEENLKGDTYVSQRKIWILTQIENITSQVDGMAQSNPQKKVLEEKVPILGICVGMQMLADRSEEGTLNGLGWIHGQVKKFDKNLIIDKPKIPHLGWNSIEITRDCPLFKEIDPEIGFYFVHSYYFDCDDETNAICKTQYGTVFHSAVNRENIYGVQFHPEKSHDNGIQLLKNFANL